MRRLGTVIFTFVSALFIALPAGAQQEYPPVDVGPVIEPAPVVAPGLVERDVLAVTGADLALWVGIGLVLVVLGLVLLRLRRGAVQA